MAQKTEKNPHSGHRDRIRQRFIADGLDSFQDHEALELLLFYAIPRRDVNELAHQLLRHFGSLSGVFDASLDQLTAVEGMGPQAAALIKLIPQLNRKYQLSRLKGEKLVLDTHVKAGQFFVPYFEGRADEVVYLACLDAKCRLTECVELAVGTEGFSSLTVKRVVEQAAKARAFSVILAHNHPGGVALPSSEDVRSTLRIAEALSMVDIRLADHIVVVDSEFASLSECGYL